MMEILAIIILIVVIFVTIAAMVFVGSAWYEAHEWDIDELHEKLVEKFRGTK